MNPNENNIENNIQVDEFNIKKIIYLILRQWYWFVLFGMLGLGGGYVYYKFSRPVYSINTSILVPERSSDLSVNELFKGGADQGYNNIFNQIEIIKSYQTINQTLINLNWRTNWYRKALLVWKGIYTYEPFDVVEHPNFINPSGIEIHITPTANDYYNVTVEGKNIQFEEEGAFNLPFVNEYFSFTLLKNGKPMEINEEYYFVFNDLNNATRTYQSKLNATLKDRSSDIIVCGLTGEQPVKDGEFLNELIRVYIEGKMDFQNEAQRRSLQFLDSQLSGFSDSLNMAGTNITAFRKENKIFDLGAEGSHMMNNLMEIETETVRSQMQLDYFKNLLSYLNNADDLKRMVTPSLVGVDDALINAQVFKLNELYNRRELVSLNVIENNPILTPIDNEITMTRNNLEGNLKNLIDNTTQSISRLKAWYENTSIQLNKLSQKEQQMINIQREFNLTNEIYTFMLQKRAETKIALASSIPDVQIIDKARAETANFIGLPRNRALMIGSMLGLVMPLGFILLITFFNDRIRAQEDVENHTNLPILGSIMNDLAKSDLTVFENPKSSIAESFRVLRTNMQFMLSGKGGKVISIHSTNPSEGKSFISINLATILAMNHKKVLIVGADMRKPRLHTVFGLSNEKGLSTYLIGYDTLDQIILPTQVENVSLMPSGPIPPNPSEILEKEEMKTLIDEVRNRFDYIILDNAPVALVTDGFIVSQLSDLNIFILRYGVSRKHQLEMINQYDAKKIIQNSAIVVNDIKINAFGYTYYKYYQYESYQKTYYNKEDQGLLKRKKRKKEA